MFFANESSYFSWLFLFKYIKNNLPFSLMCLDLSNPLLKLRQRILSPVEFFKRSHIFLTFIHILLCRFVQHSRTVNRYQIQTSFHGSKVQNPPIKGGFTVRGSWKGTVSYISVQWSRCILTEFSHNMGTVETMFFRRRPSEMRCLLPFATLILLSAIAEGGRGKRFEVTPPPLYASVFQCFVKYCTSSIVVEAAFNLMLHWEDGARIIFCCFDEPQKCWLSCHVKRL